MKNLLLSLLVVCALASCTTYRIPVENFKQQFAGMNDAALPTVHVRGPVGERTSYQTYPIQWIQAVDKGGKAVQLRNSPSIEIRFTDTADNKTVFYFDRLRVTDTTVTGTPSRIMAGLQKTISLNAIKKIEVQDGKKRYRYVD